MPQMGCVAARGGPLSDPLKEDVYQARCLWWGVVEEISGARWGLNGRDAPRLGLDWAAKRHRRLRRFQTADGGGPPAKSKSGQPSGYPERVEALSRRSGGGTD